MKNSTPYLNFRTLRKSDSEGFLEYRLAIYNREVLTTLDFWGYDDEFKKFGKELAEFPRTRDHSVKYELGELQPRGDIKWAYYLLLEASLDDSGKSAMRVKVDNFKMRPETVKTEFYLDLEPASLNKLGNSLYNWDISKNNELNWSQE